MDFVVPLKELKFLFLVLGSFFFFWGLFLPINFIILYGQHYSMSTSLAGYQLVILNAARYAHSFLHTNVIMPLIHQISLKQRSDHLLIMSRM